MTIVTQSHSIYHFLPYMSTPHGADVPRAILSNRFNADPYRAAAALRECLPGYACDTLLQSPIVLSWRNAEDAQEAVLQIIECARAKNLDISLVMYYPKPIEDIHYWVYVPQHAYVGRGYTNTSEMLDLIRL